MISISMNMIKDINVEYSRFLHYAQNFTFHIRL